MRLGQSLESFIEGDDVQSPPVGGGQGLIQRHASTIALAFRGPAAAGVVHQDLAHCPSGSPEEVPAIAGVGESLAAEEPKQSFVHHGTGLEGMVRSLAAHQPPRHAPQLVVDHCDEASLGAGAAGSDLAEEGGQITLVRCTHEHLEKSLEERPGASPRRSP
jgi:hypothetical protein